MRTGTLLSSATDGAARSPQNPEGRPHPMDLSPTIFGELMKEITFPLNGRGGPIREVPERNQARGHRSQQFHQRVHQSVSAKATRLECARQKRMENNSMEDVKVSVFTHICMFNRPLSWYIFWTNVLYSESHHTPANVSAPCTKSPMRQLSTKLGGSSILQNQYYEG